VSLGRRSSSFCRLTGRDLSERSGRSTILPTDPRPWFPLLVGKVGVVGTGRLAPGASLLSGGVCGLCGSLFIYLFRERLTELTRPIAKEKALEARFNVFLGFTQFSPIQVEHSAQCPVISESRLDRWRENVSCAA